MTKPLILAIVFGAFGLLGTFGLLQSRPTQPPSAEHIAQINDPAAKRSLVALESAKAVLEKVQFPDTLQKKSPVKLSMNTSCSQKRKPVIALVIGIITAAERPIT
jgi:hypothetical protein